MSWKRLGAIAPRDLVDARLQLHYATLVVASAGATLLEPKPDDSHPNLGWLESQHALIGRPLPGAAAQMGLNVPDLSLVLVERNGDVSAELTLDGRTLEDAYAWLTASSDLAGVTFPEEGPKRNLYEIPHHDVADGAKFVIERSEDFVELGRWFANGHAALTELTARLPGASEVRCWPHHFDLGSLLPLENHPRGSLAKSIGIGLSLGDESYPEPYWYVSPWPYPEPDALPSLERGGRWHTKGYTSAILTGSDLIAGPPEDQSDRLYAFLDAAVEASRHILTD